MNVALLQIERVRRGPRRVHADVRAVSVSGDPAWAGDLDRSRLRSGGERLRVQTEKFGERHVGATGRANFLNVRRTLYSDQRRASPATVYISASNVTNRWKVTPQLEQPRRRT